MTPDDGSEIDSWQMSISKEQYFNTDGSKRVAPNMASNVAIVTLLVKACPNHLLSKVVYAIETFGFDRAFLVAALNTAPEQVSLSGKSAKANKAPVSVAAACETSLYNNIIYMKTTGHEIAVEGMKSFVQDNLNAEHGTLMYCVEVKPKKFQTFFPVVFMHDEVPPHQEMVDLFSPFGKCNIRTKNDTMTYVNYKQFEHVEALLAAIDNSQLKFQHMVVHEAVFPVQNSKLMMLFDTTFTSERDDIMSNNCISKQQLITWFNDVKKKASCEKTWDDLVDFLGERIWMRFHWTYNADMEVFCAMVSENSVESTTLVVQDDARDTAADFNATEPIAHDNQDSTTEPGPLTPDSTTVDCEQRVDNLDEVHTGQELGNYTIFHEAPLWNDVHSRMGNIMPNAGDCNIVRDGQIVCDNHHCVVDRMNNIPLYGDASHPLHIKLCALEQQLFGKHEEPDVSIHYRLMNMELMMNINGQDQALPVRLNDLSCWIQQYLLCV